MHTDEAQCGTTLLKACLEKKYFVSGCPEDTALVTCHILGGPWWTLWTPEQVAELCTRGVPSVGASIVANKWVCRFCDLVDMLKIYYFDTQGSHLAFFGANTSLKFARVVD